MDWLIIGLLLWILADVSIVAHEKLRRWGPETEVYKKAQREHAMWTFIGTIFVIAWMLRMLIRWLW